MARLSSFSRDLSSPCLILPRRYPGYGWMATQGYKSVDCGYGHGKNSEGYCTPLSWVRRLWLFTLPSSLPLADSSVSGSSSLSTLLRRRSDATKPG